jgi:hypothetical protein
MDWIRKHKYPQWAIANFIILTLFGILLRYMQLYPLPSANYMFILHAHSHFAFAGWMFFAIVVLLAQTLSVNQYYKAYQYVLILTLISAYGMLISFSFQGYKPASIAFSTLFIVATYRFTYLVFKRCNISASVNEVASKLITGALIFLCLSSIGPFSLAPLVAAGFRNTPLYQNAIYFYLHFQMNGFMLLGSLGLFASTYFTNTRLSANNKTWLNLFIYSTIPLYFIFTLWDKPSDAIWILAAMGSCINLLSWTKLCINFRKEVHQLSFLAKAALLAITLKIVFQVITCVPIIGEWTFSNRNLIIGYIHLLTLGSVTPLILDQFAKRGFLGDIKKLKILNLVFMICVVIYLILLFLQPLLSLFLIIIPQYQLCLFACCILFLFIGIVYLFNSYEH